MPCPKTVGDLFAHNWPTAKDIHDVETYLDHWLEEHGGEYPPEREHNFMATGEMLRKAAATPKPRRRRKPAARNRDQMEIQFK